MRILRVVSQKDFEKLFERLCVRPLRKTLILQHVYGVREQGGSVFVCQDEGHEGVLALLNCQTPEFEQIGSLVAPSREIAFRLLESIPRNKKAYVRVCGVRAVRWVGTRSERPFQHREWFYTTDRRRYRPGPKRWKPRELTKEDYGLIENAEGWAKGILGLRRRAYGIILRGRIFSYCWVGSATSVDLGIDCVCGLYTAKGRRRQGLATDLLAYVTEGVISRGRRAIYYTEHTNQASQRTARRVGYAKYMVVTDYLVG